METGKPAIRRSGGGEGVLGGGGHPFPPPPWSPGPALMRLGPGVLKPSAPSGKHAGGGERLRSGRAGKDGCWETRRR